MTEKKQLPRCSRKIESEKGFQRTKKGELSGDKVWERSKQLREKRGGV